MPALTTPAILLRRLTYGETSYILTWLTASHGRLTTMIKGARQPKSKLHGQFDLFYLCEIQYQSARHGDLHRLIESRLLHPFLGLRRDWLTLQTAHYCAELVESLTEANTPLTEDYGLLEKALRYLEVHPPTIKLVQRFEKRLLQLHGLSLAEPQQLTRILHQHHHRVPARRQSIYQQLNG